MARRVSNTLTELELLIMRVVWHHDGPISVETIQEELRKQDRDLAQPSVRTMLKILGEKGYLSREQQGRGFLYSATKSEAAAQKGILEDIVTRAFDGSASNLLAALLDGKLVKRGDVDKVKHLLDKKKPK
ncbi:MAG: BlaI/MecI/CopY family transcriptional regulator [Verrucomicrobiota bacterium]